MRGIVAASLLAIAIAAPVPATAGETLDVQSLVDRAPSGSTVVVPAGVHQGPVVIGKPLHLLGEPGAAIDGQAVGDVVTIAAPGVEVAGFELFGGGRDVVAASSGILIDPAGDGAYVHDVRIYDTYLGITVRRAADVRLEGVSITGAGIISGEMHVVDDDQRGAGDGEGTAQLRGDGIWLYDTVRTTIARSHISTVRDGIYLSYGRQATIDGVTIEDSRYAVHAMYAGDARIVDTTMRGNLSGVVAMYGGPVAIEGGAITESGSPSTGFGVLIKDAADVSVTDAMIADNRVGLHIDDAGRTGGAATSVRGSTIAMNQIGVLLSPSADPVFTGNAFIENSTQVAVGGTGVTQASWGEGGVGNHWSDYTGFDADADGVGDLPYVHGGRTGQVLASDPTLLALASGPAFRLLTAVEDRWIAGPTVVHDEAPMMTAPPASPIDREAPPFPAWVPGVALIVGSAVALTRGRRHRVLAT